MDFLLALIELLSLGVMAEELRAIIGSKSAISLQWGSVDPKFQVEGVAPHQPATHQQRGQHWQHLLPAEADEELTETTAIRHRQDGGQQLCHQ